MHAYIRDYSLQSIKEKLKLILVLNVADIVSTLIFMTTGIFYELNGLVASLLDSPLLLFLVKVLLPIILVLCLLKRMEKATTKQLKISNVLVESLLVWYSLVNGIHILWTLSILILL